MTGKHVNRSIRSLGSARCGHVNGWLTCSRRRFPASVHAITISPRRRLNCAGKEGSAADGLASICAVLLSLQLWDRATVWEPSRRTLTAVREGKTARLRSFDGRLSSARQQACLRISTCLQFPNADCGMSQRAQREWDSEHVLDAQHRVRIDDWLTRDAMQFFLEPRAQIPKRRLRNVAAGATSMR